MSLYESVIKALEEQVTPDVVKALIKSIHVDERGVFINPATFQEEFLEIVRRVNKSVEEEWQREDYKLHPEKYVYRIAGGVPKLFPIGDLHDPSIAWD